MLNLYQRWLNPKKHDIGVSKEKYSSPNFQLNLKDKGM
jgi:hypothetical protein